MIFACAVQLAVNWQDQWGIFRNHQRFRRDRDPLPTQARNFLNQMPWIQHNTVADHAQLAAAHDARRQQAQLENFAINHQRMACVVTALEARDHIGTFGQPIHDLAFSLVSPLGADNNHIGHDAKSFANSAPLIALWRVG